jgi:hypothetical protein
MLLGAIGWLAALLLRWAAEAPGRSRDEQAVEVHAPPGRMKWRLASGRGLGELARLPGEAGERRMASSLREVLDDPS